MWSQLPGDNTGKEKKCVSESKRQHWALGRQDGYGKRARNRQQYI